jgi:hypothetical protein
MSFLTYLLLYLLLPGRGIIKPKNNPFVAFVSKLQHQGLFALLVIPELFSSFGIVGACLDNPREKRSWCPEVPPTSFRLCRFYFCDVRNRNCKRPVQRKDFFWR